MKGGNELVKERVLLEGLDKIYDKAHLAYFHGDFEPLNDFIGKYGYKVFCVCRNMTKGSRAKVARCRAKVGSIVEGGKAYFLTLTFRDDVLNSTNEITRRRYVSRCLKACSSCYVANVDYGDKEKNPDSNEREHYHAIVYCEERPTLEWWTSHCGFVKIKKVGDTEADLKKVCKYTAKLSNHALKRSTQLNGKAKAPRLIYSRETRFIPPAFLFE